MCDQICVNTFGSYTCQCNQGFRLDGNGQTCNGKHYELVAATVDINFNTLQTLMSVLREDISALKFVKTQLDRTAVTVIVVS